MLQTKPTSRYSTLAAEAKGRTRMVAAGIDVGSLNVSAVVLMDGAVVGQAVQSSTEDGDAAARQALGEALGEAGLSAEDVDFVVATGTGRKDVSFASREKSEIVCLARGAHLLFPRARTIIDMGAESCKVVALDEGGDVEDFTSNDKCASGTGAFLDTVARMLKVDVSLLGSLGLRAGSPAPITSTCAVFAESEVVSLIHNRVPKEEIIAGVHESIATRAYSTVNRLTVVPEVVMAGGVALNSGFVASLERRLGLNVAIPEGPQAVGALGAALIAADSLARLSR